MRFDRWLIVRANGDCRVVRRKQGLNFDEVAFRLSITVPPMWGTEAGYIDLTVPEGAVTVNVPEMITAEPETEES